jgi:hypothetical protein
MAVLSTVSIAMLVCVSSTVLDNGKSNVRQRRAQIHAMAALRVTAHLRTVYHADGWCLGEQEMVF